jgi:hypothetical protein
MHVKAGMKADQKYDACDLHGFGNVTVCGDEPDENNGGKKGFDVAHQSL